MRGCNSNIHTVEKTNCTKNQATVDYSCSSLAVTANPSDSKASVTSVTGNDSLEVGDNTVSVVVTAEDGSTGTYNIVVTRRADILSYRMVNSGVNTCPKYSPFRLRGEP